MQTIVCKANLEHFKLIDGWILCDKNLSIALRFKFFDAMVTAGMCYATRHRTLYAGKTAPEDLIAAERCEKQNEGAGKTKCTRHKHLPNVLRHIGKPPADINYNIYIYTWSSVKILHFFCLRPNGAASGPAIFDLTWIE